MNNIESAIIDTARKYPGKKEIPQNRGWRDKVLEQAMKLVGWRRGDHWCAFFMELVWKEAYLQVYPGRKDIQKLLCKLCSGNSQRTFGNFSKSGIFKTGTEPKPGAAVIWKYEGTRGHTAAAVVHVGDDFFSSIEGNVNDGIFTRIHRLDEPNRLGFIYPATF
jgi:hypothetical protein